MHRHAIPVLKRLPSQEWQLRRPITRICASHTYQNPRRSPTQNLLASHDSKMKSTKLSRSSINPRVNSSTIASCCGTLTIRESVPSPPPMNLGAWHKVQAAASRALTPYDSSAKPTFPQTADEMLPRGASFALSGLRKPTVIVPDSLPAAISLTTPTK